MQKDNIKNFEIEINKIMKKKTFMKFYLKISQYLIIKYFII